MTKTETGKDTIYDVAIVGAGPAGASLAYFLSNLNIKAVLIEKKKHADTPVRCAELVPKFFTSLFKDKIAGINNEINFMETYIEGRLTNIIKSPAFMLDRNVFINFLIREFIKKGGTYLNSSTFMSTHYFKYNNQRYSSNLINSNLNIRLTEKNSEKFSTENYPETVLISLKQNDSVIRLNSKILVGADGPVSTVAKVINSSTQKTNKLLKNNFYNRCFIAGFQENLTKQKEYENDTKIFFYPYLTCGYGWLFPKKDSINVGIGVSMETARKNGLKNIYLRFKDELIKNKIINGNEKQNSAVSGLVPVSGISSDPVKDNIILIGDAAGLCNPITGAGNFNAAASAKIASEIIKEALNSENLAILTHINKEFDRYFARSLEHARKKRIILEKDPSKYSFEELVKKTWISFKDYRQA
ncbi:MAG: FAD-dependent monooxygenase [Candidatus Humimicrobiaceae bacterium]